MTEIVHITDTNKDIIDFKLHLDNRIISNNLTQKALKAMKNKILSYLTTDEKKLIYLTYADCLKTEEISYRLGISAKSVKSRQKKLNKRVNDIIDAMLSGYRQKLNSDEIIIFEYYYCYNYNIKQIAEKVGINRNAVTNKIDIINVKMQQDKLSES